MPAYPEMGRTVVDGSVYLHGVPLAETAFARDPLNPVRDGRVRSLLDPACDCVVFDGHERADVVAAARSILSSGTFRTIAGPAAIAGALAERLGTPTPVAWPTVRTCLVVNGSRHEASRAQIEQALENSTVSAKDGAPWRLLHSNFAPGTDPLQAARHTGLRVRRLLSELTFDAVLVFGGDTAFGILESFGLPPVRPIGEILPGVPVSLLDSRREILITKAGGFGAPDLVTQLRSRCQ